MKKLALLIAIWSVLVPLNGKAWYKIVTDNDVEKVEITKIYQPYYTAISDERESSKSWTYNNVQNNQNSPVQTVVNTTENPNNGSNTDGIWVLPFLTQDKNAKDTQRIMRTFGDVFNSSSSNYHIPAFYRQLQLRGNNQSVNQTTKVYPNYNEYRKVKTLWGPRGGNTLNTIQNTTYSSK